MFKKYKDFKYGVINAIEPSEIPLEAMVKSDKFYFKENFWRKIPGLTEINATAIGTDPVWSVVRFHRITPNDSFLLAASGGSLYKFDEQTDAFTAIQSGMVPNRQVEFLEDTNFIYFGSSKDNWRRYDGGAITYSIGSGDTAPRKFKQIISSDDSGRFFAIGDEENPDYLYWSEHRDDGGMEVWPDGNVQIVPSEKGGTPQWMEIFEGRITIFSQHSIYSGSIVGVPENWSFQREKAIAGTISGRTVKRRGNSFFMLTPPLLDPETEKKYCELYKWPESEFVSKGRVKFYVDENFAHLACAEIVADRYYYLFFKSGEAVSSNKYHLWIYDILGDRFYGPHTQYNCTSLYMDKKMGVLVTGGTDDLGGYVLEHRGRNIKNALMLCSLKGSYSDYDYPRLEKRFKNLWIKCKQEGNSAGEPFKDSSSFTHIVTSNAGLGPSTVQKKFGVSSLLFDGADDYLSVPDHTAFDLSGGIWTIDFWVYLNSVSGLQSLFFQKTDDNNYVWVKIETGAIFLNIVSAGVLIVEAFSPAATLTVGSWIHVEIVQNGNDFYIFKNGVSQTITASPSSNRAANYTGNIEIGRRGLASPDRYLNGYLDEYRISKGIARHVVNFDVSYLEHAPDSFTSLLLHCNDIGSGQAQIIVNINNQYDNPQTQNLTLEDPANQNLSNTSAVKETVTKRAYIHDAYSLGNAFQFEIKHAVLNGDFAFSEVEIEYDLLGYKKEDKGSSQ